MAIMFKIMYPYFEPALREFLPQLGRNPVVSFRDKIKRGAKPKLSSPAALKAGTYPSRLCSPHRG